MIVSLLAAPLSFLFRLFQPWSLLSTIPPFVAVPGAPRMGVPCVCRSWRSQPERRYNRFEWNLQFRAILESYPRVAT